MLMFRSLILVSSLTLLVGCGKAPDPLEVMIFLVLACLGLMGGLSVNSKEDRLVKALYHLGMLLCVLTMAFLVAAQGIIQQLFFIAGGGR